MRRLEIKRAGSTGYWWEFVRGTPERRLADVVIDVWGFREHSVGPLRRRRPAKSHLSLILSFGDRLHVADMSNGHGAGGSYESFVCGFNPGYTHLEFEGGQHGLQVNLTPLGAHRVLGTPAWELASRVVDLEAIAPELVGPLTDRLASSPTWPERFSLVEQVLTTMVDRGPEPDPMVRWMWNQIQASSGRLRISDLVEETGWSHRHVVKRFRQQIGLTPKATAAVARFEHAAALIADAPSLSELAIRCGYADQSHLTREFVRLTGWTPAAFLDHAGIAWTACEGEPEPVESVVGDGRRQEVTGRPSPGEKPPWLAAPEVTNGPHPCHCPIPPPSTRWRE